MTEILTKSRITPPGLPGDIVHRTRLTNLLKANIDKNLVLICTSAGFGKTTLANDFLSAHGTKFAWYYVTADINSFSSFLIYIIHSLKSLSDTFGKNALHLTRTMQKDASLSKDHKNIINDSVATFVNEFMDCFKDDVVLAIDDLHNIDINKNGDWLNYFFDVLFDSMPANLHLMITTREIPGFNINKLKAKRRVFQLTGEDLIFDNEEILELLEKVYSISSTGEDAEILQSSMNGWITGIHLVLQAYGKEFRNLKAGQKQDYEEIFNYFARDIFENLDEYTREFLLNTAILENFSSKLCDHLLNITCSEKIISELVRKNIFIEPSGGRKTSEPGRLNTYNYQELFRLFLLSKQNELRTKEEIRSMLRKLFEYYLSMNEILPAVNYGLKAEDYTAVVPVIVENYAALFDRGNYDVLWEWINLVPDEILRTNPQLLYLAGMLYLFYRSDPERSLKYLNEALNLAHDPGNISLIVDCNVLKTDVMLLLGNIEDLMKDLNHVLTLDISKKERARLLYEVSRVRYREGHAKYKEMIEYLTEALKICNEEGLQSLKTDLFTMLGNVYSDWGDLVKAAHYYERALNIDSDVYKMFRTMNNIVAQYCTLGDYARAKEYLDRTIELCNTFPALLLKRHLLRSMGGFSYEIGDFEESIRKFEELNNLEIRNNIKLYAGAFYMWIGEAHYYLKKYDTALKNFEIALNYIDTNNRYHMLSNSYFRAKTNFKIKPEPDTERIFLEMLEFDQKNYILQEKVQLQFHLADYYLRSGNPDSALKYLKDCLEDCEEKQFISFIESEVLNSRYVFDFAISNNLQKQFIKTIFENVRNKINYEWLSDECKKRLTADVETLTDIKLYSFGKTEIRFRGIPIPEDKWVRKKSKVILAYLLTKPGIVLNKDKIIDMFLQDVPVENADTIFHNTISNIRAAVRINGSKSAKKSSGKAELSPQLIIYEDKNLSLNRDYYYESDCREFERHFSAANSASSKIDKKIEESVKAIDLYKGEFMPGYYDQWCEEMRQNYSNMFQKLCEDLVGMYYSAGRYEDAIKYAEKLIETDKLHSDAFIKQIESYVKLGNISAAKDRFALMLKYFEQELGEKPEKQVLNKINEILGTF